jgi:hypothetical protein
MFRALLAHPQEVLNKRNLVYCLRMLVGCGTFAVSLQTDIIRTQYTEFFCVAPSEDEQVTLKTCRGP